MSWISNILWRLYAAMSGCQNRNARVNFPAGILGNPSIHYVVYDRNGNVTALCRTFREARQLRRIVGPYMTRLVPGNGS